ncbi:MAG: hypothetical protein OXN26_00560 [Gammaproteobacteria bacterium]|nr:hypothetical protein [Gammaproteobacteria bacterium]
MSEVLGRNAGNALEVRETIDFLTGAWRDDRLHKVVFALAAGMLVLAGIERVCPQYLQISKTALISAVIEGV